ncbi:hypothetical protein FQN54_009086 [Arachnomyces sp. PD_36]|nr:hypothetical protein FQN54_009086 [Arachnomyces sp. PD_36]
MAQLAVLNGGKPRPTGDFASLWDMIHARASKCPDRPALLSPTQPANLYEGLTKPWSSEPKNTNRAVAGAVRRASTGVVRRASNPWYYLSNFALSKVLSPPPEKGDYLFWSFAELKRASIRLGHFLRAHGVKPGSTVVILLPVSAEWGLMISTCFLNGYTIATLDQKLLDPEKSDTLQAYIDELSPSLFVVATDWDAAHVAKFKNEQKASGICLERLASPPPAGWVSMLDIAEFEFPEQIDATPVPDDPGRTAIIVYTSGSSGNPKGCPIEASQLAYSMSVVGGIPLLPSTGTVLFRSAAQSGCPSLLLGSWTSGNSAAVHAVSSNADALLATMQKVRPTFYSLIVGELGAMYTSPKFTKDATSSVRFVLLIGFTITKASLKRTQQVFPNATIKTNFGMTEAHNITDWASKIPKPDSYPTWNGIASSGKIAPGVRVKVVDENGATMRRNEVGELHLGGHSTISRYLGGARANLFYKKDGYDWYICGDLAVIDDDDYIYVVGRADNTIKREGKTLLPATVENLLETHFTKSNVSVTTTTTSSGERGFFAVFHADVPSSSDEINELITREIGSSYLVEGVASLAQLGFDDWPKTLAGKIGYANLKAAAAEFLQSKSTKS